jgi:hypothetical protein
MNSSSSRRSVDDLLTFLHGDAIERVPEGRNYRGSVSSPLPIYDNYHSERAAKNIFSAVVLPEDVWFMASVDPVSCKMTYTFRDKDGIVVVSS